MGYFDDSDDEEEQPQRQPTVANDDDEDPLEAYMKSLAKADNSNKKSVVETKSQRLDFENEEESTDHWARDEQKKEDDDQEDASPCTKKPNALDDLFQKEGTSTGKRQDDWDSLHVAAVANAADDPSNYQPFCKTFYKTQDTAEGRQWRQTNHVHSSQSVDPILHFQELREVFGNDLLQKILSTGYQRPTLVQSQTLPVALSGKDALITAATGQGKTLSYIWPICVHIADQPELANDETGPIALVLVPTRELAMQVHKQAQPMLQAVAPGASSRAVVGGQGKYVLLQELKRTGGVEVIVATPGRLLDVLSDRKGLSLRRTTFVCLDEADKMLHMGFEAQVRKILSNVRKDRQTLMLSATMGRKVETLAKEWLSKSYVRISVGRTGEASVNVEQHVMVLPNDEAKISFITQMLPVFQSVGRTLVFVATRDGCEALAKSVRASQVSCETIHGDRHQSDRNAALKSFVNGQVSVLIATDVASRGLDIPSVATVVNFNAAKNLDAHVHRVGRAGRLSKDKEQQTGSAYTLLTPKDGSFARVLLHAFEREGREISAQHKQLAESSQNRGGQQQHGKQKFGLGFESIESSTEQDMYAPQAKRSRWK